MANRRPGDLQIRHLREDDLAEADRIERLAFGTHFGMPEPSEYLGDAADVANRWQTEPSGAFAVEVGGVLAGSSFATRWGSVGTLGPLTIHPDYWNRGYATPLIAATMQCFQTWGTTHEQLFTFADSPKHHALYQKVGFWPRFLTAVMSKAVAPAGGATYERFSCMGEAQRAIAISKCRELAETVYPGLDLTVEINAVERLGLGDTLLEFDGEILAGFAVCHCGAGTEAGSDTCAIKFGAVAPGSSSLHYFNLLLDACETFTARMGMQHMTASINLSRNRAYRTLLNRGFRIVILGVAMHNRNEPGYCRPDVFAIEAIA